MKKIILLLVAVLLISLVGATDASYIFKQYDDVNLKVSCYDENNSLCDSSALCNVTILYPNNSVLIDGGEMTYTANYFNYTLQRNETAYTGEYSCIVNCDGSYKGFSTFNFLITPTGELMDTSDSIIYVGVIVLLLIFFGLCIFAFIISDNPTPKYASAGMAYLLLVAISYISYVTSKNILSTTVFISRFFYWVFLILMIGFFPLGIFSFVYYVWLLINIKEIQDMIKHGVPEDRIYEEEVRRGFSKKRW